MSDIKELDVGPITVNGIKVLTIDLPEGYMIDTSNFNDPHVKNYITNSASNNTPDGWVSYTPTGRLTVNGTSDNKMFYNDYDKTEKLKAKCWICQKDISVHQIYNFVTAKEKITISCCQKEQVVELTEKQIKETNAQGVYWAFMC